jgi:putative FmdB family regulatory protein
MPFYEYECASCKFYTEVMQKINDTPLKKCPSCGKSTLKKLISAPVFRLKGGGWYETDFKSDKESKRNLAGEGSDSSDAKARETPAPADAKTGDAKVGDSNAADSKSGDSKSESKPTEKASASDSGASGGAASRSASKSSTAKPARSAAKPAARAPGRKPAPKLKAKAKASKRRGR